ncbi:flavin reductase family protein [Roseococcus sp. YIM B11640]|uniref:flavin reductase family protein n=1 Tax=Roseococcus sp. YIM B11640 TaxID=3133973 RepID=UPI003C7BE601
MRRYAKRDFPTNKTRRHLEPGPIVLISSAWKGETNIMTLGWHMMLGFTPALVATYIWDANHSYQMVRRSKECVINVPEAHLLDTAIRIGNCTGGEIDKFAEFGLTADPAEKVAAPLIRECYANFECRLHDARLIRGHGIFVWEVVKAHVAASPKNPRTCHYRGDGEFMLGGDAVKRRRLFTPGMLAD